MIMIMVYYSVIGLAFLVHLCVGFIHRPLKVNENNSLVSEEPYSRHQVTYNYKLKADNVLLSNCTEHFFTQYLDHYNWQPAPNGVTTFQQRFFVCGGAQWKANNTIFFYLGNEANVETYVNHTGLMWENADAFQAVMVFAEHRYWGKSVPFTAQQLQRDAQLYTWANPDQALADFATLMQFLKTSFFGADSWQSPLIGFGGSYGGMLCAWSRMKYPQWLDGCIAGSAPILDFEGVHPDLDPNYYAQKLSFDASNAGGSGSDLCRDNIHTAWAIFFNYSRTSAETRAQLATALSFCAPFQNETMANASAFWVTDAISTMAMGSYPYPSSYMTGGGADLPPFPLQLGCKSYLNQEFGADDDMALLTALGNMVNILRNVSNDTQCYENSELVYYLDSTVTAGAWNWMACSEIFLKGCFAASASDGINDMFWDYPWNATHVSESCQQSVMNIAPRLLWAQNNFGGDLFQSSNIVFSNGDLDPWSGGGVHFNQSGNGIYSISTGMVGHHMDLMFSTSVDPQSVIDARNFELQQMQIWVTNTKQKR